MYLKHPLGRGGVLLFDISRWQIVYKEKNDRRHFLVIELNVHEHKKQHGDVGIFDLLHFTPSSGISTVGILHASFTCYYCLKLHVCAHFLL